MLTGSTIKRTGGTPLRLLLVALALSVLLTMTACVSFIFFGDSFGDFLRTPDSSSSQPFSVPSISVSEPTCGTWQVLSLPELGTGTMTDGGFVALSAGYDQDAWLMLTKDTCYSDPIHGRYCINSQPVVLHWDGTKVQPLGTIPLDETKQARLFTGAVITPDDIWVAGEYMDGPNSEKQSWTTGVPLLMHWNGTRWSSVAPPDLPWHDQVSEMAAVTSDDVWAIGESSMIHWDGTKWTTVALPSTSSGSSNQTFNPAGIAAVGGNNVWIMDTYNHTSANNRDELAVLNWNGKTWTNRTIPKVCKGDNMLTGVSASGLADIWVNGFCTDGIFSSVSPPATRPFILHWNGANWAIVPTAKLPKTDSLTVVDAVSPTDAWAVGTYDDGYSLIAHWDGNKWSEVQSPTKGYSYSVKAASNGDIWLAGKSGTHQLLARFVRSTCNPPHVP